MQNSLFIGKLFINFFNGFILRNGELGRLDVWYYTKKTIKSFHFFKARYSLIMKDCWANSCLNFSLTLCLQFAVFHRCQCLVRFKYLRLILAITAWNTFLFLYVPLKVSHLNSFTVFYCHSQFFINVFWHICAKSSISTFILRLPFNWFFKKFTNRTAINLCTKQNNNCYPQKRAWICRSSCFTTAQYKLITKSANN